LAVGLAAGGQTGDFLLAGGQGGQGGAGVRAARILCQGALEQVGRQKLRLLAADMGCMPQSLAKLGVGFKHQTAVVGPCRARGSGIGG
jgi:hypothetical protein